MKILKVFVLLFVSIGVQSFRSRYCEICLNHTLCSYPVGGPSVECIDYDKEALLTNKNIVELINKINERRNLVALGRMNRFPQAANMKKVKWSPELAIISQRWADQCDRSVKPSKEDECRDLENVQVGQSIATVLGLSPGLKVKSFVDTWFMLKLHYMGSVMYYNRSRDSTTNYFTQLIWANTEFVGCGKVKFFNQKIHTVVERLVCNFAPKGNLHGRPVYTIGYPATQCPDNMLPDHEFTGLCKRNVETSSKFTGQGSSMSSLLRILNLSNNSVKHEFDPNNLNQINLNISDNNELRNQKIRHANLNNSYGSSGAIKRDSFHIQSPINDSGNLKGRHFTPERGHSRVYHGLETKIEPIHHFKMTQTYTSQDFRKYDLTTPSYTFSNPDYRRSTMNFHCTRKVNSNDMNCFTTKCVTNQCTRGQANSCSQSHELFQTPLAIASTDHVLCPCNKQTTCSPVPTHCDCNVKCQCLSNPSTQSNYCAKRRAQGDESGKIAQFNYYDLFPNIRIRSGDDKHLDNIDIEESIRLENITRESEPIDQVTEIAEHYQSNFQRPQDSYGMFYSSERKRRDFEDQVTFKPFWQVDEYSKRPSELKSLKYTTLGNKRNRRTRKTTFSRLPTETITLKLKQEHVGNHRDHITEKYLSFEELMHLRKLSTQEVLDYEARRLGDWKALGSVDESNNLGVTTAIQPVTTTKPFRRAEPEKKPNQSSNNTDNIPLVVKKHCTRKITCTWTAFTMNGSAGIIPGIDIGSRTPPGYVDGCTRTSTCTRDFMDRNKLQTAEVSTEEPTQEDEDYCERRSLNVQRRNVEDIVTILSIGFQEAFTELPLSTSEATYREIKHTEIGEPVRVHNDCVCDEDTGRVKRGETNIYDQQRTLINNDQSLNKGCTGIKARKNTYYTSEDFYSVLQKISKSSKCNKDSHQCSCNCTKSIQKTFSWEFLVRYGVSWSFYYVYEQFKRMNTVL